MPGICRTWCRLVTMGPFVSNSFHSGPLFTDRSGLIRVLGSDRALPGMFFCTSSSNCLNKTKLFTANISVFFCLLLFLNSRPGEFAGKVPLPRRAGKCKHCPAKGVTPDRALQCSFRETFLNVCEFGCYCTKNVTNFPSLCLYHKPGLSFHIVLLKILP